MFLVESPAMDSRGRINLSYVYSGSSAGGYGQALSTNNLIKTVGCIIGNEQVSLD